MSSAAFRFVLTMGIVNLFGDMTYEGGASVNGQFLASLGASAAAISIIAGAGECLGYGLRAVSGYVADKTGRYWAVTFVGYAINTLAVPAMALTGNWYTAGALILAERTGRAIRKPTVEAMLSYSTGKHGKGWVYAMNTALDETGAMVGPLLIAFALSKHVELRSAYGLLLISSALTLLALAAARIGFPVPSRLEQGGPWTARAIGFSRAYWLYMVAASCFAGGLMTFELLAFHLSRAGFAANRIPMLLALGTASAIAASLTLGRLYDRIGIGAVVTGVLLTAGFSPLVFFGRSWLVVAGLLLWGVGYAVQDTLLKALIASVLPEGRRNAAFGVFYLGYGGGWLVGSVLAGVLYSRSLRALVTIAIITQLIAIPIFVSGARHATLRSRR
ncbi:MAG TPA: MFS transporter [Vicinamibacterales bacterium]|nr:MFS transporter [Vicinamibacterales bacterium]